MADFKPSDVPLYGVPLTDTFGKTEMEVAAALLVRTLQRGGDTWRPVPSEELLAAAKADMDEDVRPIASLLRNPFLRPDFGALDRRDFTRFDGTSRELTALGLDVLRRFVARHREGG